MMPYWHRGVLPTKADIICFQSVLELGNSLLQLCLLREIFYCHHLIDEKGPYADLLFISIYRGICYSIYYLYSYKTCHKI